MANEAIGDTLGDVLFKTDVFSPSSNASFSFPDVETFGEAFKSWPQVVVSVNQRNKLLQAGQPGDHAPCHHMSKSDPAMFIPAYVLSSQTAPELPASSEQRSSQTCRKSDAGVSCPAQPLDPAAATAARTSTGGFCEQQHEPSCAVGTEATAMHTAAASHPGQQPHGSDATHTGPPPPATGDSLAPGQVEPPPTGIAHQGPSTSFFDMLVGGATEALPLTSRAGDAGPLGIAPPAQPAPATRRPSGSLPPNLAALGKFVESMRSKQQSGGGATTSGLTKGGARPTTSNKSAAQASKKCQATASASCASMEGPSSCRQSQPGPAISSGHTAHSVPLHLQNAASVLNGVSPFQVHCEADDLWDGQAGSSRQQTHAAVASSVAPCCVGRPAGRPVAAASMHGVSVGSVSGAAGSDAEWPRGGSGTHSQSHPYQQVPGAWQHMGAMPLPGRARSLDYSFASVPYPYPPPHPMYGAHNFIMPPHLHPSHSPSADYMAHSFPGGLYRGPGVMHQQRPWGMSHPEQYMMPNDAVGQPSMYFSGPMARPSGGMGRMGRQGLGEALKGSGQAGSRGGKAPRTMVPQDDAVVAAGLVYRAFRRDTAAVMLPRSMQLALSEDFRKIHQQLVVRREKRRQMQAAGVMEHAASLGDSVADSVLGSPMASHAHGSGGTQQEPSKSAAAGGTAPQQSPLRPAPSGGHSWQSVPTGLAAKGAGVDASPIHHSRRSHLQPMSPSGSCPAVCTGNSSMGPPAVPHRHLPRPMQQQHHAERPSALAAQPAGVWWPAAAQAQGVPQQL